jgi:hypothetical protein
MTEHSCTCGYQADDDLDLIVHFGEVFTPADDIAPDGVLHAEAARPATLAPGKAATLTCRCGFTSPADSFDRHLADAFTPADRIGQDGEYHAAGSTARP